MKQQQQQFIFKMATTTQAQSTMTQQDIGSLASQICKLSDAGREAVLRKLTSTSEADKVARISAEIKEISPKELKELRRLVERSRRVPKDPNRPKGASGPYIFFSTQEVSRLKSEDDSLSHKDATRLAGSRWKALTEEEKEPFRQKAAEDKARFEREMANYTPSEEYVDDRKTKKRRKPEGAPKGACNAYIFFSVDKRKELVAGGMTEKQAISEAGKQWKAMTAEQRRPFNEKAAADKARYERENAAFKGEPAPSATKKSKTASAPTSSTPSKTSTSTTTSTTSGKGKGKEAPKKTTGKK